MKKKIIIVIVVLMILLVPIPIHLKDGGTVIYKSLIYKISKVHRLTGNLEKMYEDGIIIEILGKKIYNNVDFNKINGNTQATIEAVVVKVNENNLLAMGIKNENGLYSVGLKDFKDIKFDKGQKILIYFNGDVMESYPAQLGNINKIDIMEEKTNIDIPDDILRYCYSSRDNVKININELTNSGITLTITDKNELPYKYSHSYKINKKIKNENYTGVGKKIGEDTENSTSGFTRNRIRIYMARSK